MAPGLRKVNTSVQASTFDKMREAEERFGLPEPFWPNSPERHVRKGRVGAGSEELGREELCAIERRYGDLMMKFGFFQPNGSGGSNV